MPEIIYVQSTGTGFRSDSSSTDILFRGYSGKAEHKNNPNSQCVGDYGPIPTGWYDMELLEEYEGMKNVVRLKPDPGNDMCGRSGFLIHGDSVSSPGNASSGCIIVNDAKKRKDLAAFLRLRVISYALTSLDPGPHAQTNGFVIPSYLGAGFRSYATQFGNRVINHDALTETPPEDARVESKFGIVMSQEDFESVFSADASVAGSYGAFSAEARASLKEEFSRSQTSVSIAFTRKVVTGMFRLFQFPVTKQAIQEAKTPSRFVRSYGDSIVSGIGMGGSCCYIFKYDFKSETEAREFRLSISARYGSGSGSYSQEQRQKLEKSQARISFRGYTTGTLNVPDLFEGDKIVDTDFLFGAAFTARMISGLLNYYDDFPKNFVMGTVAAGYSQCEQESQSLAHIPKVFAKQDDIADTGDTMRVIATSLRTQKDYCDAIDGQLAYMEAVQKLNLPVALKDSLLLRRDLSTVKKKIDSRMDVLLKSANTKDQYDFRSEIPALPKHYCTADPEVRKLKFRSPHNSWTYKQFDITGADYERTCWIEASADINTSNHRPNGGVLTLVLYKATLAPAPTPVVEFSEKLIDPNGPWVEVERKYVSVHRPHDRSVAVGGFLYVPAIDKCMYRIGVHTSGDYRGGSHTYMTAIVSRQTTIII